MHIISNSIIFFVDFQLLFGKNYDFNIPSPFLLVFLIKQINNINSYLQLFKIEYFILLVVLEINETRKYI
jgi:hypothetical protein